VTSDEIASFDKLTSEAVSIQQTSSIGIEGEYAAIGGLQGDLGIFSLEAGKLERSLKVTEPITDVIWSGSKILLGTAKGSVKIFDSGSEVASFSEHAGAVTGLAIHPSSEILASVGGDKSVNFYYLESNERVARIYADSGRLIHMSQLCPSC
jgi:pre-mRNA-processing factor 19